MTIPELIQLQLESIYDFTLPCKVNDFIFSDVDRLKSLDHANFTNDTQEKLLIRQGENDLEVSLYLAEQLLSNLDSDNPFYRLSNDNLSSFCTAIEGVSHFSYLIFNAIYHRQISQLELEVQAEVDKFVTIITLAVDQQESIDRRQLMTWLFDHCVFDPMLDEHDTMRYQAANYFAGEFCDHLQQISSQADKNHIDYSQLRRFYRKRHLEKINECNQTSVIKSP